MNRLHLARSDLRAAAPQQGTLQRAVEFLRRFSTEPSGLVGGGLVLFFIIMALLAPTLAPYRPFEMHMDHCFEWPSRAFPLGTDEFGRDLFTRVLYGARISLRAAMLAVLVAACLGVPLGAIAGYAGGSVDQAIMRCADIFLAFPSLVLAMGIAAALGRGLNNAILAVGIAWWPVYARLVRSTVLSVKEEAYVEAARSAGAEPIRILGRHILPNCLSPVLVKLTMDAGTAVLMTAALSFLGLGDPPQVPEWGAMISNGRQYFLDHPWSPTLPGLAVFLIVMGASLLGDSLRNILDPTLRWR